MAWFRRLRATFKRSPAADTAEEEMRFHLQERTDEYVRAGMTSDAARCEAIRRFGSVALAKDRVRDIDTLRWLGDLDQDLRYAGRILRKSPGFTSVTVLTLALGIGANTAVFSLLNSLLLNRLPVRNPERLVLVSDPSRGVDLPAHAPNQLPFMWGYRMWEQIRQRPQLFDGAFGYFYTRFNLASGGETEFVGGLYVSGGYFKTLGVSAVLGRALTDADDQQGGDVTGPVAVIGHAFWQRRFGGAADVLRRRLSVERVPFTIVGVLPPGFVGPAAARAIDVAIPMGMASEIRGRQFVEGANWITIMARLKPGQSLDAATAELRGVQPQIREASRPRRVMAAEDSYLKNPLILLPADRGNLLDPLRVRSRRPLMAMQMAVVMVLLIACANIANLTLARAVARRHEMSLRLALGASRLRIARQLFVESLLLAVIGAACSFPLAQWGIHILVRFFSTATTTMSLDVTPDSRVLAFTTAVAVAVSVLIGVIPARRAAQIEPMESLKDQSVTVIGSRLRLARSLVVIQVALSLVLVVGGGLLIRTYTNLITMELGFDSAGLLIIDVQTRSAQISPAERLVVFGQVRRAVAAVPGVAGAAFAVMNPVTGGAMLDDVDVSGAPPVRNRETFVNRISPGWLSLYGTRLLNGRDFTEADRAASRRVAIVNQAFARKFLNGADPLGRVIRQVQGPPGRDPMEFEVIGVAADAVYNSLRAPVPATMYLPFDQIDEDLLAKGAAPELASLSVRGAGAQPMARSRSIAAAIAKVNPDLDLTFRLLPDAVSGALTLERTLALLSGFFSALALLLAAVGLYGVTSYEVSRRRAEIGIRMALGATPGLVVRQILSPVLIVVGVGLAIGAAASIWASQFVTALLYGLEARDPMTLGGAVTVLSAVGALAGWLPARRASRVDPMMALRCE
jgi:putative ABC transport system permease protein